jgi:hypothetical protein
MMLNRFAKLLLVATSLSPILGAVVINKVSQKKPWDEWLPWLCIALLLILLCWLILEYIKHNGEIHTFHITQFESNDREVLTFLIAYLLPFLSSENMAFDSRWLVGAYVLILLFVIIAHSGALHFNPIMGLLGYHFYSMKNEQGIIQLLITKTELRQTGIEIQTTRIAYNIYISLEEQRRGG